MTKYVSDLDFDFRLYPVLVYFSPLILPKEEYDKLGLEFPDSEYLINQKSLRKSFKLMKKEFNKSFKKDISDIETLFENYYFSLKNIINLPQEMLSLLGYIYYKEEVEPIIEERMKRFNEKVESYVFDYELLSRKKRNDDSLEFIVDETNLMEFIALSTDLSFQEFYLNFSENDEESNYYLAYYLEEEKNKKIKDILKYDNLAYSYLKR
ncbi:MAG: hypothetical protein QXS41_03705, partial [Candidatus Woesearchaeota archaeon]